jgi:TatD DNase family protein
MVEHYVDAHSHAYEYSEESLASFIRENNLVVVGVSDDYASSLKTLRLSRIFKGKFIPCIGLHPWEVKGQDAIDEARHIVELALEENIRCLGEIGLDTKFVGETIHVQREVFKIFLEAARDYNLFLNLHTAGTWEEVLNMLLKYDIERANFHWYTGPLNLLKEIYDAGYTISINPAVKIQEKHRSVVKYAPLEIILTESDSPYEYRGMRMSPELVAEVVNVIAEIKGVNPEYVRDVVWDNFRRKIFNYII